MRRAGITRGDVVGFASLGFVTGALSCAVLWAGAHITRLEESRVEQERERARRAVEEWIWEAAEGRAAAGAAERKEVRL